MKAISTGSRVENNIQFASKTNKFIDTAKSGTQTYGKRRKILLVGDNPFHGVSHVSKKK